MTIIGPLSSLSLLAFSATYRNMLIVRLLSLRLGRLLSYLRICGYLTSYSLFVGSMPEFCNLGNARACVPDAVPSGNSVSNHQEVVSLAAAPAASLVERQAAPHEQGPASDGRGESAFIK